MHSFRSFTLIYFVGLLLNPSITIRHVRNSVNNHNNESISFPQVLEHKRADRIEFAIWFTRTRLGAWRLDVRSCTTCTALNIGHFTRPHTRDFILDGYIFTFRTDYQLSDMLIYRPFDELQQTQQSYKTVPNPTSRKVILLYLSCVRSDRSLIVTVRRALSWTNHAHEVQKDFYH